MNQNHPPVPRLDLAPKLKSPLSLWNPLDYLRLLYWVFFFPQALRQYEFTFRGESNLEDTKKWRDKLEWLRQNSVKRQLILQALVLIFAIPIGFNIFLLRISIPINWSVVVSGVALAVAFGVGLGMEFGVASGVGFGMGLGVVLGTTYGAASGMASSIASGLGLGLGLGASLGVKSGVGVGVASGIGVGAGLGVGLGVLSGVGSGVGFGVSLGVGLGLASAVAIARPENWLFALPSTLLQHQQQNRQFPHVTPIPLPYLSAQIANWLRRDWETGLHNIDELLKFTLQFIPVVKAVNRVLAETPKEQLIYRVAQLSENPYDWDLVRFASASLSEVMKSQAAASFAIVTPWQQQIKSRFQTEIRLNTPARAAAAGFWYLHEQKPDKATEAFAVVRDLLYGEEMFTLAQIITSFHQTAELADIVSLNLPPSPNPPLLRKTTWQAIASLRQVIADVKLVQNGVSRSARSFALNRASGQLKTMLSQLDIIPKAEIDLITKVITKWIEILLGES
ncbi:MAG: ATP-binding protein, partial [Oscillatoriales cyanobacterium RU_3_3]|nr:ATP-binding protein [Oscillatoriales cyanobacterium RU_3_3]